MIRRKHVWLSAMLLCMILVSSVGIVVNSHYCGGKLKSKALFTHAKDCYALMGDGTKKCTHPKVDVPTGSCIIHKAACCQDASSFIFQKVDWNQTWPALSLSQWILILPDIQFNILPSKEFSWIRKVEPPPPRGGVIWLAFSVLRL